MLQCFCEWFFGVKGKKGGREKDECDASCIAEGRGLKFLKIVASTESRQERDTISEEEGAYCFQITGLLGIVLGRCLVIWKFDFLKFPRLVTVDSQLG